MINDDYFKNINLWDCPSDTTREVNVDFQNYSWTKYNGKYINRSYVIDQQAGQLNNASTNKYFLPMNPSKIQNPSIYYVAYDYENGTAAMQAFSFLYGYDLHSYTTSMTSPRSDVILRHNAGNINVLAADGGVRQLNLRANPLWNDWKANTNLTETRF